ncbi:uncharacterized protein LOC143892878 [Tasmannia lanceolata]|uniref:uncharacterized protein LOC143892878 n=1 Tax=Tasmannia lanceolata TaxID=3420 RepID=UPI004062C462
MLGTCPEKIYVSNNPSSFSPLFERKTILRKMKTVKKKGGGSMAATYLAKSALSMAFFYQPSISLRSTTRKASTLSFTSASRSSEAHNPAEEAKDKGSKMTEKAKEKASEMSGKTKESMKESKDKAKGEAEMAKEKTESAAESVIDKTKEAVQSVGEKAKETVQKIKETMVGKSEEAAERVDDVRKRSVSDKEE